MIIANPLYDVVFKYLLEDIDIAKEILATILNEPILYLEVKPQETATVLSPDGDIRILRFDFKATIEMPTGEIKKVLVELQKLKKSYDIMRFRRYLGDNYGKEDDIILGDGTTQKQALPIVTIYILGFPLDNLTHAVVKVNRDYVDVLTGETIQNVKEDFIELLTHDSFIIQTRFLPSTTKTKLERILQIFNPKFMTKDSHKLDFNGNLDEPIVQKIIDRLRRAVVDEELRKNMDVEDEIERILAREAEKVSAEKDEIILGLNQTIAEKEQTIAEKEQAIAEKEQALLDERQKRLENEEQAIRNLIQNTDLSDEKIASILNVSIPCVQKHRIS
jgi:hypothetical protein